MNKDKKKYLITTEKTVEVELNDDDIKQLRQEEDVVGIQEIEQELGKVIYSKYENI